MQSAGGRIKRLLQSCPLPLEALPSEPHGCKLVSWVWRAGFLSVLCSDPLMSQNVTWS